MSRSEPMPHDAFIPFHRCRIEEDEISAIAETLRSGWLTTGPKTREFEAAFAKKIGAAHAVAVCSGTAALHLALEAVGVRPGDEVIVPTMTFTATAEVVVYLGATPVLVDCESDTLNLDPQAFERAITARTRAVIPVHFAGHPCEMDAILAIARRKNIAVVEDAAHAFPCEYRDQKIGTIGDVTCFSFYSTKTITTGEGGMAVTNSAAVAERMRIMSLHGISKDAWKRYTAEGSWYYEVLHAGFKYNMTDIAATLGLSQLKRADTFLLERERCAAAYNSALDGLENLQLPMVRPYIRHAWHLYTVRLQPQCSVNRDEMIGELKKAGIGTSVHFIPLHMQPFYRDTYGYREGDLPVARSAFQRILSLPIYPSLTNAELERIIAAIKRVVSS